MVKLCQKIEIAYKEFFPKTSGFHISDIFSKTWALCTLLSNEDNKYLEFLTEKQEFLFSTKMVKLCQNIEITYKEFFSKTSSFHISDIFLKHGLYVRYYLIKVINI